MTGVVGGCVVETEESVVEEKEGCRIATKELDCPQPLYCIVLYIKFTPAS